MSLIAVGIMWSRILRLLFRNKVLWESPIGMLIQKRLISCLWTIKVRRDRRVHVATGLWGQRKQRQFSRLWSRTEGWWKSQRIANFLKSWWSSRHQIQFRETCRQVASAHSRTNQNTTSQRLIHFITTHMEPSAAVNPHPLKIYSIWYRTSTKWCHL